MKTIQRTAFLVAALAVLALSRPVSAQQCLYTVLDTGVKTGVIGSVGFFKVDSDCLYLGKGKINVDPFKGKVAVKFPSTELYGGPGECCPSASLRIKSKEFPPFSECGFGDVEVKLGSECDGEKILFEDTLICACEPEE